MRTNPQDRLLLRRLMIAVACQWLRICLLPIVVLLPGPIYAQPTDGSEAGFLVSTPRVQILEGRISTIGLQLYRLIGLKKEEALYVHAKATSGYLDPVIALIKPEVDLEELAREPLDELVRALSRDHDPIEVTRQILERYALAGSDDSEGHYYSAFSAEIPEDGEYWLAIGSSLVRPSAGTYRLVVGVDAPDVLSDNPESSGPTFVFAEKDAGALERGVVLVTGELSSDQVVRFYYLADMAAAQTFYAYAKAIDSDLKPALILHDHSDKPVAYGNYTATDSQGWLQYKLPRKAENFRLEISSQDPDGKLTAS